MRSPSASLLVLLLACTLLSYACAGGETLSQEEAAKLTAGMIFCVIGTGIILTVIIYCCSRWMARRRNPTDPGYFTARKEEPVAITFEPATDCEFSEDGDSVFSSAYSSPLTTSDSSSLPQGNNMWLNYVSKVREVRANKEGCLQPSPKEQVGNESDDSLRTPTEDDPLRTPTSEDSRLPRYSELFGSASGDKS